jgi:hypothetical protein
VSLLDCNRKAQSTSLKIPFELQRQAFDITHCILPEVAQKCGVLYSFYLCVFSFYSGIAATVRNTYIIAYRKTIEQNFIKKANLLISLLSQL